MDPMILEIVKLLVTAAVVACVYVVRNDVIPLVRQKLTSEQIETAKRFADIFVKMADQTCSDMTGAEKKTIVLNATKDALKAQGIEMTDQFIDDMIEATVRGLRIAEQAKK